VNKTNKLSRFAGKVAEIYTNIHLHFNTSRSVWTKVLVVISWPLRIVFNLPGQLVILANYFYGSYLFRIRNRLEIFGLENLPFDTGNIFFSNHQAWTDPWGVGISLSSLLKIIFFPSWVPWTVADEKNYSNQWFGAILWLAKITVVRRGVKDADTKAKERWKKLLRIGNMVLYPEGTRTRTGELLPCKKDVARFIYDNFKNGNGGNYFKRAIPIRIIGFNEIQPAEVDKSKIKSASLNPFKVGKGKKCQVIIGKPIEFAAEFFQQDFNAVYEQIGEMVMQNIGKLSPHNFN
jgi:1-acyl-sn-glycerol-3-phosphate acyltransferase